MNMFAPTKAKTPDDYIEMISDPTRKDQIKTLHEFIKKTIPDEKPHIMSGMIGYGTFHYKSKSGREGDWAIVALSSRKNYISIYICAADGKQYVAEKYKQSLGKVNIGKSCITFKKVEDIDLSVLKKAILEGMKTGFAM